MTYLMISLWEKNEYNIFRPLEHVLGLKKFRSLEEREEYKKKMYLGEIITEDQIEYFEGTLKLKVSRGDFSRMNALLR